MQTQNFENLVPEEKVEKASANFDKALDLLRPHFPNLDATKIDFVKMSGSNVGKATESGIEVDPIMLMHPVYRLAHVLAHEMTHLDADADSEGLVEAYLHAIGLTEDGGKLTAKYDKALADFYKVADVFGPDRDLITKNIYDDYKAGRYEKIYLQFLQKGGDPEIFWDVFPELYFDDDGNTEAISMKPYDDALAGISERVDETVTDAKKMTN